ncbi:MAG: acetoacetyl-CoA reductase [Alphaproteobacteria bacterium]|jgi:acetoacetyl-CoA reductase|nr:acetoacetyl-CoA reductase [Alphaproteobacteria bacterium]QQS56178.1 MAG: acetoacetyl-CoA reductase [Alphaproteobacteria bacterium]
MNKVAIVTGGTRGIGHAISLSLKADGFDVVATYHGNEEAAQKFRTETGCEAVKFDVADYTACEQALKIVEQKHGPIQVLVNNAGITRDGMLHKMPKENWHEVIETNLTSCFNMCRLIVPGMRERSFGRIINISSINGQKGQFGQVNYSAAKAGMLGLTKALATEVAAKGITVNAICPGYIATDMTAGMKQEVLDSIIRQIPVTRMGHPDEIAALVSFLASEKAAFITGTTIAANGGQYMS